MNAVERLRKLCDMARTLPDDALGNVQMGTIRDVVGFVDWLVKTHPAKSAAIVPPAFGYTEWVRYKGMELRGRGRTDALFELWKEMSDDE